MSNNQKNNLTAFSNFYKEIGLLPEDLLNKVENFEQEKDSIKDFSYDELYTLRKNFKHFHEQRKEWMRDNENSFNTCLSMIEGWIERKESRTICSANIRLLSEVFWNPSFANELLPNIDLMTTHSIPISLMLKQKGNIPEEIYGLRLISELLFSELLNYCNKNCKKIFLISNKKQIIKTVKKNLMIDFPGLKIGGEHRICSYEEIQDKTLINEVNQSNSSIVFVSLPSPLQEIWLAKNYKQINAVMAGTGRNFLTYGHNYNSTPYFVKDSGLEWLYLLLQDPVSLWDEYSVSLPTFSYIILRNQIQKIKSKILPLDYSRSANVDNFLAHICLPTGVII